MKVKKEIKIKKMTIDKLAIMVAKGFEDTATKDDLKSLEARMATKTDIQGLKEEIKGVKNQLEGTNKRIDDLAMNRVKYEDHNKLKARVDFIEKNLK